MVVAHPVTVSRTQLSRTQNVQHPNVPHPLVDGPSWPSTCTLHRVFLVTWKIRRIQMKKWEKNILMNDGVRFGHLMRFPVCPRFSHMISSTVHDKATALMVIWERWHLRHHDSEKFLCSPLDGQKLPRFFTVVLHENDNYGPLAHGLLTQPVELPF
jgi:hypothetical protein